MKKILISIIALCVPLLCLLTSCMGNTPDEGKTYKVMLSFSEGVTVTSQNPVQVKEGEAAEFEVSFGETYTLKSLDVGTYTDGEVTKENPTRNGKVVIENVTRNTTASLIAINLEYDTSVQYKFRFNGADGDSTTIKNNTFAYAGTIAEVEAKDNFKKFIGWSVGRASTNPSDMISTDRKFEFRLSPELLVNAGYSVIELFANYVESGTYFYDLNGGVLNEESPNMKYTDYYSATKSGESMISVKMSQSFLNVCESVSLFYDDGTFTREGYVLKEYNTEADGGGVGYSLGSMYYIGDDAPVLYCIWEKATPAGDFTYEERSFPCPFDISKEAGWKNEGVYITGYKGDDKTVVIPEMIDGKYVIGIAYGAFNEKSMETLVFSKYIRDVEDTAFTKCSSLETVYYSDAIYRITDNAFDASTYLNLHNFYVNATMAPRYSNSNGGSFSVKLSRVLASMDKNRVIVIAGSSVHLGLSSTYMEALLDNQYTVVNFGTTRTVNCTIFLEAMGKLTHEGDIIIYAPENSSYMVGEREIYWKTLREVESMYNVFRHIDIKNYTGILSAFSDYNMNYRLKTTGSGPISPTPYEVKVPMLSSEFGSDKYGDSHGQNKGSLQSSYYGYYITFNERYKSKDEGNILSNENLEANKDYNDKNNKTWTSINEEYYTTTMNAAISGAKRGGAAVCFGYCPADADAVVEASRNKQQLLRYEELIKSMYTYDKYLGSAADHVFAHEYFYDSSFHLNDVGRAYHTYKLYLEICESFGRTPKGFRDAGVDFKGCIFESGSSGTPLITVDWLS